MERTNWGETHKIWQKHPEEISKSCTHMSKTTALTRSAILIYDPYEPHKQLQTVNTFHTVHTFRSVFQACIWLGRGTLPLSVNGPYVSFSSPCRTVTRHKEGAVAERKRKYTYIFLVLKECYSGNATEASPNFERKHLPYGPYVSFSSLYSDKT